MSAACAPSSRLVAVSAIAIKAPPPRPRHRTFRCKAQQLPSDSTAKQSNDAVLLRLKRAREYKQAEPPTAAAEQPGAALQEAVAASPAAPEPPLRPPTSNFECAGSLREQTDEDFFAPSGVACSVMRDAGPSTPGEFP